MFKLIKLEWKKNNITKYVRNAAILLVPLFFFVFALGFSDIASEETAPVIDGFTTMVDIFTSVSFLIFTSVMLSTFIVSAYTNKTMNLICSYPISRKKILASQMLAVWIFCFFALIITKFIMYGTILICSNFMDPYLIIDYDMTALSFYMQLVLSSISIVSMSFIALFIGLVMYSPKATIISSFILTALAKGSYGDFTLANNILFPAILTIVSLIFAFLSIQNVEKKDLI